MYQYTLGMCSLVIMNELPDRGVHDLLDTAAVLVAYTHET